MDERKEEIVGYGMLAVMAIDLVNPTLSEEARDKLSTGLEQVGRKRYGKLVGLVTVLLKENGLSEEEALQEAIRQVGEIVFEEGGK